MSRIGRAPIEVPEKVEVKINGTQVSIRGPKGHLENVFSDLVKIEQKEKTIVVSPVDTERKSRAMWGLTRTLINNMVVGVTDEFKRVLEFNGVGYRAAVKGNTMTLNLGYSHPIEYELPEGINCKVVKNTIELTGCNKELLGFAAAKIRSFRPPEPYKGKGVKYLEEHIIRKAGKSGAKK